MIVRNDDSEMQEAHLKYRTRAELQSKGLKKKICSRFASNFRF